LRINPPYHHLPSHISSLSFNFIIPSYHLHPPIASSIDFSRMIRYEEEEESGDDRAVTSTSHFTFTSLRLPVLFLFSLDQYISHIPLFQVLSSPSPIPHIEYGLWNDWERIKYQFYVFPPLLEFLILRFWILSFI